MILEYSETEPENNLPPEKLVIFLHGYGSHKDDLIELAQYFTEALPNAHFISPNAPEDCEGGFGGYQWFSLQSMYTDKIFEDIQKANQILNSFIDEQLERLNLQNKDLILIGFSQGATMAMHAGLRREESIAGIISFSGKIGDTAETLEQNLESKTKILLTHGTSDTVLPYESSIEAERILHQLDIPFESFTATEMDHSINQECIEKAQEFFSTC